MLLYVDADVALLEQDRLETFDENRVAKTWLQSVPAWCQGRSDVTNVLVVHAKDGAEFVTTHRFASSSQAVFAHPLPVDSLLPVHSYATERCHGFVS